MRTQATTWLNSQTMKPVFGIKVFHGGRWMNVCNGSDPLLFDVQEERDAYRKELSKNRGADHE